MEFIFSHAMAGILSSICLLIGGIPYLIDIHKGRVKPHILSWLGWGLITALGGAAMVAEGSTWAVALLFANTVVCLLIAAYSALRKAGVWSTGPQDIAFFVFGLIGLILWQITDVPMYALVLSIIADASFGIPTIIKTLKDPSSETLFPWSMSVTSEIFGMLALKVFAFHEVAYPLYLFFYDITILLIVIGTLRSRATKSVPASFSNTSTP